MKSKKKTIRILLMACLAAIIVTAAIVAANIVFNTPGQSDELQNVDIEGSIEFSGGYDPGGDKVYINPLGATPVAFEKTGIETKALDWWIVEPGIDEPIYSGNSQDLEPTLLMMAKLSPEGLYVLQFRVECESGTTYRMGRNFYIMPTS